MRDTPVQWCKGCGGQRKTYRAAEGDSAAGALCCVMCSRVLVPKPRDGALAHPQHAVPLPAPVAGVSPQPDYMDIAPEIRVVRIYRNGSWLEDTKAGGRRRASFPAVEPTPEPSSEDTAYQHPWKELARAIATHALSDRSAREITAAMTTTRAQVDAARAADAAQHRATLAAQSKAHHDEVQTYTRQRDAQITDMAANLRVLQEAVTTQSALIARLTAQVEHESEAAHYATGVADLAMKHRNAAEATLAVCIARNRADTDAVLSLLAQSKQEAQTLRGALEQLRDCDWMIGRADRKYSVRDIARDALAASRPQEPQ